MHIFLENFNFNLRLSGISYITVSSEQKQNN